VCGRGAMRAGWFGCHASPWTLSVIIITNDDYHE
jgi:hypothetical protein